MWDYEIYLNGAMKDLEIFVLKFLYLTYNSEDIMFLKEI